MSHKEIDSSRNKYKMKHAFFSCCLLTTVADLGTYYEYDITDVCTEYTSLRGVGAFNRTIILKEMGTAIKTHPHGVCDY